MNKIRLISAIALVLAILNGVLLVSIWKSKKHSEQAPKHLKGGPIEILGFDDVQRAEFDRLKAEHKKVSKSLVDQENKLSKQFYYALKSQEPVSEENKEALLHDLAQLRIKRHQLNYDHFADIKAICRGDQLEKFNEMMDQLSRHLMNRPPPRRGDRHLPHPPEKRPGKRGPSGPR